MVLACIVIGVVAVTVAPLAAMLSLMAVAALLLFSIFSVQVGGASFYLALLALTLPFQFYLNLGAFPLSTAYVLVGMAASAWVLNGVTAKRWRIYISRESLPMLTFLAIVCLTSLSAADKRASVILGVQVVAYFVVFIVVANVFDSESRIMRVIWLFLVGAIANALLGIGQALIGLYSPPLVVRLFLRGSVASLLLGIRGLQRLGDFGPEGPEFFYRGTSIEGAGNLFRAFGTFEGPTMYGWFTTTLAVFAVGFFLTGFAQGERIKRIARRAAFFSVIAVFFSWTRSAWLGSLIGFTLIVTFRSASSVRLFTTRWSIFALATVTMLGLVITVGRIFPESPVGRVVLSAIGGEYGAGSNAGRIQTARFALSYFRQHPFAGVGFGNYPYFASGGAINSQTATLTTAHNTYLELGVELGVPGLVVYLAILFLALTRSLVLIRQPIGTLWHSLGVTMAGVWISFVVMLFFSGNIVTPRWMICWWFLAGLQVAATRLIRREQRGEVNNVSS